MSISALLPRELQARIQARPEFHVELLQETREASARLNPRIGAYLSLAESPLAPAENADQQSPLWGMPIAVKDNICTATLPTTCASRMLADYRPHTMPP
ncbi:MAG: amidase family protein [Planctomycetaceae bacterium]